MIEGIDFRTLKNKTVLVVKQIDKKLAKETVIKNHYSHSWYHTFGIINFGIFKDNEYLGCAVFGHLKVPKSYKNICNGIEQNQIIELNRLWLDDKLGKNSETVFLGLCFKQLKLKYPHIKLVQSFADGRLGCGTIYKASNFLYYGSHKTVFYQNPKNGRIIHEQIFHNSSRPIVITHNLDFLENEYKKFEVKTYRYIYFLDRKLINMCKLKSVPYPNEEKGQKELKFIRDDKTNIRYIENTCKHIFYTQKHTYFRFLYNRERYLFTKEMYENGVSVFDILKNRNNTLF